MDEVSEPLLSIGIVIGTVGRHVESPLSQEGLRVRWHITEIVHDHEHLDHRAQGVEQGQLDGASVRNPVALLTKIDVTLWQIIELQTLFRNRKYLQPTKYGEA